MEQGSPAGPQFGHLRWKTSEVLAPQEKPHFSQRRMQIIWLWSVPAQLKSPSIPSALLETAFISNPTDEAKLLSEEFQNKMAAAVADALRDYGDQFHVAESE